MRILPRPDARSILFVVLLCLMGYAPARAQVLAQRNWAGSGVTIEPWWRRAVFYRMDPETFQDSNGDGKGDLAGVTQRLDYLQSLGVDALILKNVSPTVEGFDDLTRAAVGSHVRVLVELGAPASQSGDAAYVAEARQWLNQGAAGLYVPTGLLQKVDGAGHIALLLHQLRAVTDSFPGGRVLLADAPNPVDQDVVTALAKETQLTASAPIAVAGSGSAAASLRTQLMADLQRVLLRLQSRSQLRVLLLLAGDEGGGIMLRRVGLARIILCWWRRGFRRIWMRRRRRDWSGRWR
jgi:hypothetical protein